ncbi:MAG: TIGR04086 family membrane protein [Defluviitaleaceae bacterium]|nr:TIGR04086 family membrane protein [Defluviitaleaceae bacterium]
MEKLKILGKFPKEQWMRLMVGIIMAYAITATALIATAVGITYTGLQETALPIIVAITCFVSVLVAGFDASRKAESNGWIWGMVAGGIYALVLLCIVIWVSGGFVADLRKLMLLVLAILGGGVGGMIGINFKKR